MFGGKGRFKMTRCFSLSRIMIESDASQVIGAIMSGREIRSEAGTTVVATKDTLLNYEVWQTQHYFREANKHMSWLDTL